MTRTTSRALRNRSFSSGWQIAVLLVSAASFLSAGEVAPRATPVKDADAKCATCHEKIYREYLGTPMANASGAAEQKIRAGSYLHAPSGVEYSVSLRDGRAFFASRSRKSVEPDDHSLSYFLGSGHLGTTYLYSIENYLFETPIAWYTASHGYEMKP
jgi:hypothetical protein